MISCVRVTMAQNMPSIDLLMQAIFSKRWQVVLVLVRHKKYDKNLILQTFFFIYLRVIQKFKKEKFHGGRTLNLITHCMQIMPARKMLQSYKLKKGYMCTFGNLFVQILKAWRPGNLLILWATLLDCVLFLKTFHGFSNLHRYIYIYIPMMLSF